VIRWTSVTDRAAFAICWVVVVAASQAHAEPTAEERVTADALFREGKALLSQKKYEEACPKLEESQRLDPQGGTLLSLAMCHEGQGRVASAWVEYEEALSIARRSNRPDRVRVASQRMKALQARVPRLTIVVSPDDVVEGLTVTRNGAEVGRPVWGTSVPVDPGEVEIVASAPGYKPWRIAILVEEGKDKTIVLPRLTPEPKPEPEAHPPSHDLPPPASLPDTSRTTTAYIVGGAGVVALGVGAWFGIRAIRKVGESNEHCQGTVCDQRGVELNDEANRAAWVSNGCVGAGVLAVGVSTWLLLTGREGATVESGRKAHLAPVAGSREAGILLTGSW